MDTRHMLVFGGNSIYDSISVYCFHVLNGFSWLQISSHQPETSRNSSPWAATPRRRRPLNCWIGRRRSRWRNFCAVAEKPNHSGKNRSECFHGSFRHWKFIYCFWGGKDLPRWVEHHEGQMKELVCSDGIIQLVRVAPKVLDISLPVHSLSESLPCFTLTDKEKGKNISNL